MALQRGTEVELDCTQLHLFQSCALAYLPQKFSVLLFDEAVLNAEQLQLRASLSNSKRGPDLNDCQAADDR